MSAIKRYLEEIQNVKICLKRKPQKCKRTNPHDDWETWKQEELFLEKQKGE